MELPKNYDPKKVEPRLQKFWEEKGIYTFDPGCTEKIYSIDTPPPTVSGKMHLGHAFGNSQQDFIARYKRMRGFNVLQPFGTDDNGLPTKLLIEKIKKVRANDLGRNEFRKLCLDTLNKELKPSYTDDWKRLGISCDFNVSYSTIDPHSQKISQKSFLDLYKSGREYRTEAPAMFCPKCMTAISQVECEDNEVDSHFNDIIFKVDGKDLIIATTRPELLPACVAVFYNPTDKRYKHLNGKKAKVPLFNIEVPIMEDERPDPEKGTGIVMCCTFGDQTDMEWQKSYHLPIREAIGQNGRMTKLAEKYEGMKPEEARKHIIEDLKLNKLLVKQEQIRHAVNVHERCGTPVEFIHSKQWFIKYLDLKDKMVEWGNELEWHPKHMKNRFDNWVGGLQWDWCISRQIPFGIPFPVWYCKECDEVILAEEEDLPVDPTEKNPTIDKCPKCGCKEFVPEKDIINTWATSSLTPTLVKELFKGKPVYDYLVKNPMDLRPQGHDIISFWLFNTVVKSNLHFGMKPWQHCFINGWMLDPKGKKMSKSKGNVIEPQIMIDKYSADALRYMASGCKLGDDLPFPEKDVLTGKKTITKLWNASKFVFMNLENKPGDINFGDLAPIDRWLMIKLDRVVNEATGAFESFEFSKSKFAVDNFFWNQFTSNYLEIVKDRFFNPDTYSEDDMKSAKYTLYHSLLVINKLFAPFIPFITEEIYQLFFKKHEEKESLHITQWPLVENFNDSDIEREGNVAIEILSAVRKFKSENNLSLKEEISKVTYKASTNIENVEKDLKAAGKIKELIKGDAQDEISEGIFVSIVK